MPSVPGQIAERCRGSFCLAPIVPFVVALALIAACGDESTAPVPPGVASVEIVPDSVVLGENETAQLTAVVKDAAGTTLTDRAIGWSSSDPAIVAVDSTGIAVGLTAGSATIMATSEHRSGTAAVDVYVVFVALGAGGAHTCGLTDSGAAYCWGSGPAGSLGTGRAADSSLTPRPVAGGLRFSQLSVGWLHSCALTAQGQAYCWGPGRGGELGNGDTLDASLPVPVAGSLAFTAIDAGVQHTCGIVSDGSAHCWGQDHYALGVDPAEFCEQPGVSPCSTVPVPVSGGHTFRTISAGQDHSCGMSDGGSALCWGRNSHGQLGTGAPGSSIPIPTEVSAGLEFGSILAGRHLYSCAITTDGTPYCWGHNDFGQLGRGFVSSEEADIAPVSGGLSLVAIDGALFHTCGLTSDSSAYCWGDPLLAGPNYTPVLVTGGLKFGAITTGAFHTCGLATDGVAYCWGNNRWGQLGDGTTEFRTEPTPIKSQLRSPAQAFRTSPNMTRR